MQIFQRNLLSGLVFMSLAACGGGEWPRLKAEVPTNESRLAADEDTNGAGDSVTGLTRVGRPAAPQTENADLEAPTTAHAALDILKSVNKELTTTRTAYEHAFNDWKSESDADEKAIKWRGAQMALSRVAMGLQGLDAITLAHGPQFAPMKQMAELMNKEVRAYVKSASAMLNQGEPK